MMIMSLTNLERKSLMHGDGIGIVKNSISQEVQVTSWIICSKVVKDGSVSDQDIQLSCSVFSIKIPSLASVSK